MASCPDFTRRVSSSYLEEIGLAFGSNISSGSGDIDTNGRGRSVSNVDGDADGKLARFE